LWYISIIPKLGRLRQFKASLEYIVRPCLKTTTTTTTRKQNKRLPVAMNIKSNQEFLMNLSQQN
jgi:hypothetical protein